MSDNLITFAIVGYKQEKFIREAVEGAFAQTYSPLEIILSDDRSPDGTFKIMEEMAAAYRGPHRVILNQPVRNLGLSAHLDNVARLAKGEWIVIAAGDDISLPDRVANHMVVAKQHPKAHSIFLAPVILGDERSADSVPKLKNRVLRFPETLRAHGGGALGATHAVRRCVWEIFGDLGPGITCEDWVMGFRSSMLGEVVMKDLPGVRYRLHEQSLTSQNFGQNILDRQLRVENNALQHFLKDLQVALKAGHVPAEAGESALRWLSDAIQSNQLIMDCVQSDTLWKLVRNSGRMLVNRKFAVGNYKRRLGIVMGAFRSGHFARGQRGS